MTAINFFTEHSLEKLLSSNYGGKTQTSENYGSLLWPGEGESELLKHYEISKQAIKTRLHYMVTLNYNSYALKNKYNRYKTAWEIFILQLII